jgi:flagellar protein FlaJ
VVGASANASVKKDSGAPVPRKTATQSGGEFIRRYRTFCYKLLGERLDRRSQVEDLAERLKQAGVNATPGLHRAVLIVTTILAAVLSTAIALVLFLVILHSHVWYEYTGLIVLIAVGATVAAFQSLVGTRISNRKEELDRELPFTLSEMSVMASTGMSPIALIHRMARRTHDPAMTGEFKKIVYKTDIQGKDIISALAETAKESPSNSVREAFWDMGNMIHQGGNLDEYFRAKSDAVLALKRLTQKEFIERLTTFLDMYVSLVLIGVLMIAVGAFLINAFQSTAAGLDANELLLLLTFGMVPMAVVMTAVMISMAYAKAE